MSKTVFVGCKLPHGIVIELPNKPDATVTLKGLNSSNIIGAPYAVTEVDEEFWAKWIASNAKFGPVESGAIFQAKSETELKATAKSLEGEKTGFEPALPQDSGVVPATAE